VGSEGPEIGPVLVVAGLALVGVGLLVWAGIPGWFGRLPGDIRYEGERTRIYIPLSSMVIVSLILTLILHPVRRLF